MTIIYRLTLTISDASMIPALQQENFFLSKTLHLTSTIGQDLEADHIQLKNAFGYDHSFVLNGTENQLTLEEPVSGRRLIISTTAPVVQVYTGNFLKDGCIGKAGRVYENREGVALETQLMPNAINTEENPSTILRKGDKFESNTKYVFEIM